MLWAFSIASPWYWSAQPSSKVRLTIVWPCAAAALDAPVFELALEAVSAKKVSASASTASARVPAAKRAREREGRPDVWPPEKRVGRDTSISLARSDGLAH